MNDQAEFSEYLDLFSAYGGTDGDYLRVHFRRYVDTYQRVLRGGRWPRGAHVLDVGAHWLHQSLMYARTGLRVTAVDLPQMLAVDMVRNLAQAHAIELLPVADLEYPDALHMLPAEIGRASCRERVLNRV